MNKKPGFWDRVHIYYGPEWDQEINLGLDKIQGECFEVHADGVKEVKCDFCDENCGNDYCYTNRKNEENN